MLFFPDRRGRSIREESDEDERKFSRSVLTLTLSSSISLLFSSSPSVEAGLGATRPRRAEHPLSSLRPSASRERARSRVLPETRERAIRLPFLKSAAVLVVDVVVAF